MNKKKETWTERRYRFWYRHFRELHFLLTEREAVLKSGLAPGTVRHLLQLIDEECMDLLRRASNMPEDDKIMLAANKSVLLRSLPMRRNCINTPQIDNLIVDFRRDSWRYHVPDYLMEPELQSSIDYHVVGGYEFPF